MSHINHEIVTTPSPAVSAVGDILPPGRSMIQASLSVHHALRAGLAQSHDHILPVHANLMQILAHDPVIEGLVRRDMFSGRDMLMRAVPTVDKTMPGAAGPYPREIGDGDETRILAYLQAVWSPDFQMSTLRDCIVVAAQDGRFHPVREWLDSLVWDGVPRLATWLTTTFRCTDDGYTRAVAAKTLIAAVRRVRTPGCKFDTLLVLEGDQGQMKSTALRILFGDDWFTDNLPNDLSGKDAPIALAGVWGIELGEIDQIVRSETETVKAFLSRQVDRYRPPYGRRTIDVPRQCILVGTTNRDDYLRDPTGNRRFWPVRCPCTTANLDWLTAHRVQLRGRSGAR